MGEKRRMEAELVEKCSAVAQLADTMTSKDDGLAGFPRQQVNGFSRLQVLSELWQKSRPKVFGNRNNRTVGIGWKRSSFELPKATVTVMTVYDKHLLIGDRSSGELFLYDVNSYRYLETRFFPYENWTFEGLAVHCGKIYADLYDKETYQLGLYSYDLSTDRWTELYKKPNHDSNCSGMTIAHNKMFLVGGYNFHVANSMPLDVSRSVYLYDLIRHEWRTVPTTHELTARLGPSCVVSDNKLLIGGGRTDTHDQFEDPSKVEVLSLETGQCVSRHSVKCSFASLATDETGIVIVTGGFTSSPAGHHKVEPIVELSISVSMDTSSVVAKTLP